MASDEPFVEAPPNPGMAIESLRNLDYSFETALADVMDNSIDAGATRIDVLIDRDVEGEIEVLVVDNGRGMTRPELIDGMTYGSTSADKPRARLGRFGMGMKTASTSQARRLEVVSRKDGAVSRAVWDLDSVIATNEWRLLTPEVTRVDIDCLDGTAPSGSGTLVKWLKVDRFFGDRRYQNPAGQFAATAFSKKVKSFRDHAEMVFCRFLDCRFQDAPNVEIFLNGESLHPWDPFCESEPECIPAVDTWIPLEDEETGETHSESIGLRSFILPAPPAKGDTASSGDWSSREAYTAAKMGPGNQGFYVYRENRLISATGWIGLYANETHQSRHRLDLSFEHVADEMFSISVTKTKVSGKDLEDVIKAEIAPARREAGKRNRHGETQRRTGASGTTHSPSNDGLREPAEELTGSTIRLNPDTDEVTVENETTEGRRVVIGIPVRNENPSMGDMIRAEATLQDGVLWEPAILGTNMFGLLINASHPFYEKVYSLLEDSPNSRKALDYLFWALAQAELNTTNEKTKEYWEEAREQCSRILKKLATNHLPEES